MKEEWRIREEERNYVLASAAPVTIHIFKIKVTFTKVSIFLISNSWLFFLSFFSKEVNEGLDNKQGIKNKD